MAEAVCSEQSDGHWLLSGELGFGTVPALLSGPGRKLADIPQAEVDLAGVTRADSAGLALLIAWTRASGRAGNRIRFTHVPDQLLSIVKASGLDGILPLEA